MKIGYQVKVYLPIFNDVAIGETLNRQQLMAKIPMFRNVPGNKFTFTGTKEISNINFFTNKGNMKNVQRVAIVQISK